MEDFAEKQHFLNTVYERFFQGYSVKVADTHGIVYTPQAIVDFMCASVAEVLETEFGKSLGDKDVNILDPCTGTGNFIVNLIRRIPKKDLPRVYRQQLFANEVMLLPYYIAALNIEHAYFELTGNYEPFEGLCFVDTLDMAEAQQGQFGFMTEANTERVERQKKAPITVIIGNPPYNVGQINENDNNKNRKYAVIDKRIRDTYAKDSSATNKNALSDPVREVLPLGGGSAAGSRRHRLLRHKQQLRGSDRLRRDAEAPAQGLQPDLPPGPARKRPQESEAQWNGVQRFRDSGRRRHHDRGSKCKSEGKSKPSLSSGA